MKVRKHFIFHGRVQGVGFRITMYQNALRAGVTGWVRNKMDGTVEACLQGEECVIQKVIAQMESVIYINIERIDEENLEILENEQSFEMKY